MNMLKKILVLLPLVVLFLSFVLLFTKPAPIDHINNVKNTVMNVVHQELMRRQLPEEYAVQASMEADEKVNSYLQTHLEVKDYFVVNVGLLTHHGNTYPITIGTLGKVHVLIDEAQARKVFLKGWSAEKEHMIRKKYEGRSKD